jgi:RNA 3'-terminal phosphate cyclase (ATP)
MIAIDGADGGGQLLRTALSLAIVTDTSFRIEDVRGNRPTPGLKPQHLAAVRLAADLCDAEVTGAEPGADSLTFRPGDARCTSLRADVGTAGSVTLLFDTVLPVAATGDGPVRLTATGGTDVKWAPTVEYYRKVKLPLLATVGVEADVDLAATGFYPAGGGEATLRATPSSPVAFDLETRGALERVGIYSKASESLADRDVADRQADHARDRLDEEGYPAAVRRVEYVPTRSPGSSLLLRGVYERTLTGTAALGERGRTSEAVADDAVQRFIAHHDGGAPVDAHTADQLMVFLALAGGRVRIPAATAHVRTNLDVIAAFGSDIRLDRQPDGTLVLAASAHPVVD